MVIYYNHENGVKMKNLIISAVLVLLLMPLTVSADNTSIKVNLVTDSDVEDNEKTGKQLLVKESVEKRLNQLAEKIKVYSEKPKESMGKITDAWIEKRRSEIWTPVLDKLAKKIEKNPESETIQQEIKQAYDKMVKDLNKEAEIRGKLKIDKALNEWALGKEDAKLTEEEKRLKKEEKQTKKDEKEKALDEQQKNDRQTKIKRKNPDHDKAVAQLGIDIIIVQKAIDRWSEKRKIAIWNQALDQLVTKTWEESDDAKIQKEIDKYFDELIEKLNKEENIKAKLDRIVDETFFNFLMMMSLQNK